MRVTAFLAEDFPVADFLLVDFFAEDFRAEDFFAVDFFAEDFLAEDFFAVDFFDEDLLRVRAAFFAEALRFRLAAVLDFPRAEPLLTVAQARRSASSSLSPLAS